MSEPANKPIYLDYAATTPLDSRVRDAMLPWLDATAGFGNASSATHAFGNEAGACVAEAAANVAQAVGAAPEDVVWTSGATEADNLAIVGAARFHAARGKHIVTGATEHKAVLASCELLEREGFEVTYLPTDAAGLISVADLQAALRDDTVLVSLMHANNETGVIHDIAAFGAACRERGILFHVDAAQSFGKLPLDMHNDHIDLLSINAHKACGPKGVGALVLNGASVRRVAPQIVGGGQQRGMRAGTLATHQIAGFAATARLAMQLMAEEVPRIWALRDRLWVGLSTVPEVYLNGAADKRLCSILNVSVAGVEGESLRFALDDLAVASGSACNSGSGEPSYVLRSLGRTDVLAEASIRFSLGRFTTAADIDQAIASFKSAVGYLRELSAGMSEEAAHVARS